jgi:hypothetical protein
MLLLLIVCIVGLYIIFFVAVSLLRKLKCPEKSLKYCMINTALIPVRLFNLGPYKFGDITLESCMKV